MTTDTEIEVIKSVSYSQDEILENIIRLHTGPIDCDVTFGSGSFYKKLPEPQFKFDIAPRGPGIIKADVRELPLEDGTVSCVAFDPPFTGGGRVSDSIIKQRFSCEQSGVPALLVMYQEALHEISRILKLDGWLIFKCQDVVESGKNYFSHVFVFGAAAKARLYAKDLFILLAEHRLPTWHMKQQHHARKYHSYFWVFQKIV